MKSFNAACLGTVAMSVVATMCILGCSTQSGRPLAPSPRLLDDVRQSHKTTAIETTGRPTLALVLGGGGLRGFAHLGVIRALEESGIEPDILVGTSAGALVGAAYASGLAVERIEEAAREVRIASLIDFTLSSSGLMRGDNIARWIDRLTGDVPIEHFPRRFGAVATDLKSGNALLFDKGNLGVAVQASAAVPGPNVPFAYQGGHLVDGGVSSLVPVRFARAMGADVVIAVDVLCDGPSDDGPSVPAVLLQVGRLQSCMVAAQEKAEADVVISPAVRVSGMSNKEGQQEAIQAGYAATMAALKAIKKRSTGGIDWVALRRAD